MERTTLKLNSGKYPSVANNQISTEYDGLVWGKGIAGIIGQLCFVLDLTFHGPFYVFSIWKLLSEGSFNMSPEKNISIGIESPNLNFNPEIFLETPEYGHRKCIRLFNPDPLFDQHFRNLQKGDLVQKHTFLKVCSNKASRSLKRYL